MAETAAPGGVGADLAVIPAAVAASAVSEAAISAVAAPAAIGNQELNNTLNPALEDVIAKLQSALGSRLLSVILYGSAAMDDRQERRSDFNLLCVLSTLGVDELGRCGPVFHNWRQAGNPPPLLLTEEEVRTSSDCFPIEFTDMKDHRRVLFGSDVIANLQIDRSFYRAQVEHELRAKEIRLRQRAADVLSAPEKLVELMADSLSTFCVLGRHALVLSGREPRYKKAEVLRELSSVIGNSLPASNEILAIRSASGARAAGVSPVALFEQYLQEVDSLVRFVDRLDR